MGLFGLLRRSKPAPAEAIPTPVMRELPTPPLDAAADVAPPPPLPPSPTTLRQMLFDAIARGDEQRLLTLCNEHRAFIREYAAGWLVVPDSLRANPAAADWYTRGLQQLTRLCA